MTENRPSGRLPRSAGQPYPLDQPWRQAGEATGGDSVMVNQEPHGKLTLLLVEDDDVAAETVVRSLRRFALECDLVWARDGHEALQSLRGRAPEHALEQPLLVLLDLNMPRMDGFEFLEQLRADPQLQGTVVFVLTTSSAEADKKLAYLHHVAGYLVKSELGRGHEKLCKLLAAYREAVCLPLARARQRDVL